MVNPEKSMFLFIIDLSHHIFSRSHVLSFGYEFCVINSHHANVVNPIQRIIHGPKLIDVEMINAIEYKVGIGWQTHSEQQGKRNPIFSMNIYCSLSYLDLNKSCTMQAFKQTTLL